MIGGYPPGNAALLFLAQVAAVLTPAQPGSTSRISDPSGLVPRQSIRTCGTPGNLAYPAADHANFPVVYPAASSVPRTGMSVGVVLSRMIRVISAPFDPSVCSPLAASQRHEQET